MSETKSTLLHFKQYNDGTVQCLVPINFSTGQLNLIKKNPLRPSVVLVVYLPKQVKPCLRIQEPTFPYPYRPVIFNLAPGKIFFLTGDFFMITQ